MHTTVTAHTIDRWGRPQLLVGGDSPLAELIAAAPGPVPMRVHAASLRPLEVPDRVRARVVLSGFLDTTRRAFGGLVLLCGEVLTVSLDDTLVDPDVYAAANCDPHVDAEFAFLRELRGRPVALARACDRSAPELVAAATAIAPSGLDRYGLTVWLGGLGWVREIRLPFATPTHRDTDLPDALALLLAADHLPATTRDRRPRDGVPAATAPHNRTNTRSATPPGDATSHPHAERVHGGGFPAG